MRFKIFILSIVVLLIGAGFMFSQQNDKPHQYIILKADDMVYDSKGEIPERWRRFINFIETENIKAGIGIIGESLEGNHPKYFDGLKAAGEVGNIDFWNHGYSHLIKPKKGIYEFIKAGLKTQIRHIKTTNRLAKQKLGITLHAFGAPGNGINADTTKAINHIDQIKIWLFGNKSEKLTLYNHKTNLEIPTSHPNFKEFRHDYTPDAPYIVYQLHPNEWDDNQFQQFKKCIAFLKQHHVEFVTPYEYYQIVSPQ